MQTALGGGPIGPLKGIPAKTDQKESSSWVVCDTVTQLSHARASYRSPTEPGVPMYPKIESYHHRTGLAYTTGQQADWNTVPVSRGPTTDHNSQFVPSMGKNLNKNQWSNPHRIPS